MKTVYECIQIARDLKLNYYDFERISDELLTLKFKPFMVNFVTIKTLSDLFGDSFYNYTIICCDCSCVSLHVIVRPSDYKR